VFCTRVFKWKSSHSLNQKKDRALLVLFGIIELAAKSLFRLDVRLDEKLDEVYAPLQKFATAILKDQF